MTLKRRIAFRVSIAFSLLLGIVIATIYVLFRDFRREEFKERFKKRLEVTENFMVRSSNFEKEAPVFFDENADNVLLNEKILIFDTKKSLIYSTVKDKDISWDPSLLQELDHKPEVFREDTNPEIFASVREVLGKKYYIVTSAEDTLGKAKLEFLMYTLIFSYLISSALVWLSSSFFVERLLRPLHDFQMQIGDMTAHKLMTKIPLNKNAKDEIGMLTISFNTMLARLDDVFQSQKDFTASASHEIQTPLTRIAFQIENLLHSTENRDPTQGISLEQKLQQRDVLWQIKKDVYQLSEMTRSLMLLSKFDKESIQDLFEPQRIDEVIFQAYEITQQNYPNLEMDFQIKEDKNAKSSEDILLQGEPTLSVLGIRSLLEIVFVNLFKNAALYSSDNAVGVFLVENSRQIMVEVVSNGETISTLEQSRLFDAFKRGEKVQNKPGSGLGLRIVKRVLRYHHAQIFYDGNQPMHNIFRVIFYK